MNAIEIEGLTKYYRKKAAIEDIDLSINEGDIYGFIGPNGAGKSTTIKALFNFIKTDKGSAKIFGLDSVKEAKKIREITGYVSSDVRFYPNMTSLDIFKYTAEFHHLKDTKKIIDYYVDLFAIDPNKKAGELSLGNKKKIAITAGLLANPRLLILDEPTNGLDPLMQHRLFQELKAKNDQGMTIFLSSHDLNEVQSNANRAAFIRDGRIVTIQEIQSDNLGKVLILKGQGIKLPQTDDFQVLAKDDHSLRVLYTGNLKQVFTVLEQPAITDFTVTIPDLEDQFMRLYEGKDI